MPFMIELILVDTGEIRRMANEKVKIVTDSTCDLSKELLHKYDISVLPLLITMGDKSYKDGEDISPEEIYEWSDRTEETPKTALLARGCNRL